LLPENLELKAAKGSRKGAGKLNKKDQAMKCIHCGGEMKPGTIPFHIDRKDCHVTLDKMPAWVCGQCGEAYFEE
jgi:YgiT-type zinc finger domain-containing protein